MPGIAVGVRELAAVAADEAAEVEVVRGVAERVLDHPEARRRVEAPRPMVQQVGVDVLFQQRRAPGRGVVGAAVARGQFVSVVLGDGVAGAGGNDCSLLELATLQ